MALERRNSEVSLVSWARQRALSKTGGQAAVVHEPKVERAESAFRKAAHVHQPCAPIPRK